MALIDPEKEKQRLTAVYSDLTDEQLFRVAADRHELSDLAQIVLNDEFSRRKIVLPLITTSGTDEVEFRQTVTVRQFRDLPEALLAEGSLKSAGIEAWLVDDNLVRMDWFVSNFIGGIKLQVNVADAAAAAELLNQPIPDHFDFEGTEEYQQPHCPKCQSLDTTFQELNKSLAYPSAWLGIPLPVQRSGWKCQACGDEWENEDVR